MSGPLLAFTQSTTLAPSTEEFDDLSFSLVGRFTVLAIFEVGFCLYRGACMAGLCVHDPVVTGAYCSMNCRVGHVDCPSGYDCRVSPISNTPHLCTLTHDPSAYVGLYCDASTTACASQGACVTEAGLHTCAPTAVTASEGVRASPTTAPCAARRRPARAGTPAPRSSPTRPAHRPANTASRAADRLVGALPSSVASRRSRRLVLSTPREAPEGCRPRDRMPKARTRTCGSVRAQRASGARGREATAGGRETSGVRDVLGRR